jgi:membrane protein insertase Oxa1/YidC/SpoIIIJ
MVVMNPISTLFGAMPGAPVETTHFVSQFIAWVQSFISNYGWTVVLFTIALKLVMMPLDLWQKQRSTVSCFCSIGSAF